MKKEINRVFTDLKKAYDKVNWFELWNILKYFFFSIFLLVFKVRFLQVSVYAEVT